MRSHSLHRDWDSIFNFLSREKQHWSSSMNQNWNTVLFPSRDISWRFSVDTMPLTVYRLYRLSLAWPSRQHCQKAQRLTLSHAVRPISGSRRKWHHWSSRRIMWRSSLHALWLQHIWGLNSCSEYLHSFFFVHQDWSCFKLHGWESRGCYFHFVSVMSCAAWACQLVV